MSSEKRRIAPNALERDVPPLKTKMAASFPCRPKSRFKVQQTQKSFSMIVSTTPRPAPVSPKRAARSVAGRRATLSIEIAQRCVGDRDERWPHPGGCLRSEEQTSELQSLMSTSYAVFCLKKTK